MAQTPPPTTPTVTFIPADEAARLDAERDRDPVPSTHVVTRAPWEKRLAEMANSKKAGFRVPRDESIKKTQVVDSILDAFQLVGGTSRLALWANDNPGEFFKIYAKLAPRQLEQEIKNDTSVQIIHVLPKGKLDQ